MEFPNPNLHPEILDLGILEVPRYPGRTRVYPGTLDLIKLILSQLQLFTRPYLLLGYPNIIFPILYYPSFLLGIFLELLPGPEIFFLEVWSLDLATSSSLEVERVTGLLIQKVGGDSRSSNQSDCGGVLSILSTCLHPCYCWRWGGP